MSDIEVEGFEEFDEEEQLNAVGTADGEEVEHADGAGDDDNLAEGEDFADEAPADEAQEDAEEFKEEEDVREEFEEDEDDDLEVFFKKGEKRDSNASPFLLPARKGAFCVRMRGKLSTAKMAESFCSELSKEIDKAKTDGETMILEDFDISQNKIPVESLRDMFSSLSDVSVHVERFRCFGVPTLNDEACEFLAGWLSDCTRETAPLEMHLSDCAITDVGFDLLARALEENDAFPPTDPRFKDRRLGTYLRLENNYISDDAIQGKIDAKVFSTMQKNDRVNNSTDRDGKVRLLVGQGRGRGFDQRRGEPPAPDDAPAPKRVNDAKGKDGKGKANSDGKGKVSKGKSAKGKESDRKGKGKDKGPQWLFVPDEPVREDRKGKGKGKGREERGSDKGKGKGKERDSDRGKGGKTSGINQTPVAGGGKAKGKEGRDRRRSDRDSSPKPPWEQNKTASTKGVRNERENVRPNQLASRAPAAFAPCTLQADRGMKRDREPFTAFSAGRSTVNGSSKASSKGSSKGSSRVMEQRPEVKRPRPAAAPSTSGGKCPYPWEKHFSDEHSLPYFWNSKTGAAAWEKPF